MEHPSTTFNKLYSDIKQILASSRKNAMIAVNHIIVETYWNIGKHIVDIQGGEDRATYGDALISEVSKKLTVEFGNGYSARNLRNMRQFYLSFPIWQTVSAKLSWSHYLILMRVSNHKAREYYATEAAKTPWSVRQLERQVSSQFYERLLASCSNELELKQEIDSCMPAKAEQFDPLTLVRDPFVLEFLDVKPWRDLQETELENAIISHLEDFLLELGRGFAFMGRQKRITLDGQHFYPDLVFYNVLTKSYVIIDLKMGRVDYSDIGQMQLYVNYYNMEVCNETDNPTIGIILCAEKNDAVVKYTLGNRTDIGVFSSQYKLYMPSEEELKREIEITRQNFNLLNQRNDE